MPDSIARAILDAELPSGALWSLKPNGGLDTFLSGMADNNQAVIDFLKDLSYIRDPLKTQLLDDLEREYGIAKDPTLSELVRRQRLASKKTAKSSNGTDEFLQAQLRSAGFDVYVYRNDPPVNPADLLNESFTSYFGGENSYFGGEDAYFGSTTGELVVNGLIYKRQKLFTVQMGSEDSYFGGEDAYFGAYEDFKQELNQFEIPSNPAYWPLIFFVGGAATFNPDGSISSIAQAIVDIKRRSELRSLIVKYKPAHTWCGLIVYYTQGG